MLAKVNDFPTKQKYLHNMVIKNEKFSLQIYNENLKILGFSLYYSYSQTPPLSGGEGNKKVPGITPAPRTLLQIHYHPKSSIISCCLFIISFCLSPAFFIISFCLSPAFFIISLFLCSASCIISSYSLSLSSNIF